MPFLDTPRLRIHYEEAGSGPEVFVLVHGNFASWRWWKPVLERLPAGWRAIAPDLRGCGETSGGAPDETRSAYGIPELAEDLAGLVDRPDPTQGRSRRPSFDGRAPLHLPDAPLAGNQPLDAAPGAVRDDAGRFARPRNVRVPAGRRGADVARRRGGIPASAASMERGGGVARPPRSHHHRVGSEGRAGPPRRSGEDGQPAPLRGPGGLARHRPFAAARAARCVRRPDGAVGAPRAGRAGAAVARQGEAVVRCSTAGLTSRNSA